MSKLKFYVPFIFLLFYLTIDVLVMSDDGSSRPIVQLVAGIALLSIIFYNFIYSKRIKRIFYQWFFLLYWGLFVVLILGYYGLSLVNLPTGYAISQIRNVFVALFIFNAILFVYNATINKRLKDKTLWFLIIFLIVNALFDLSQAVLNPRIRPGNFQEINTSSGYVFVMILPLLMYLFRKNNKWIFALTLVLTLISGKRGALVIYAILILYSVFQYSNISSESKLNWKTLLFAGVALFGVFFFMEIAYESFLYRFDNLERDDGAIGSGRSIFWALMLNHWIDSDFIYQIIGSGFYSTISVAQKIAHNDYLQYLVDYGVVGLSIWCLTLFKYYSNIQKIKYYDKYLHVLLVFCVIILIGRGLFAGTLRTDQIYLSITIGYLIGMHDLKRKVT